MASLCAEFGLENLRIIPETAPGSWKEIVSAADVAFHGHFSSYGDISPWVQLSMAMEVPVLVSDFASAAELSSDWVHPDCSWRTGI